MTVMLTRRSFVAAAASLPLVGVSRPASAEVVARAGKELTVLSDGSFKLPLSMLARDVPAATLEPLAGGSGEVATHLNVTCLRRGEHVILFDCGSGANFLPGSGKLAASLEEAGIAADSVTHVLFTHLHPDHFWGAIDEFDSPAFPNAQWLVNEAEFAYWSDPGVFAKLSEDRHMFAAGAQRIIKGLGDRLERRRVGQEWLPGIAAFDTAGHTPGHVSFELKHEGETLFVLGDALTHPKISFAHPDWKPSVDHDADRAIKSRKDVLARAAGEKARILGYHLPGALGRVERDGSNYRFVAG
jgi:glyoxylase-like metal-dependent hydrolase (beta-lactamase superfamily II)